MTSAIAKRIVDIVVATVLLVVALPIIGVSALLTMAVLRTSPFFTQTRIGRNGEPFKLLKVRTLPRSTPRYANKYEVARMRIPAFSRMLRRLHLDELPQLLLVLTGKMSLVGPRPEMPTCTAPSTPTSPPAGPACVPGAPACGRSASTATG